MKKRSKYTRISSNQSSNSFDLDSDYYFVEYRRDGLSGFFLSNRKYQTFEEAKEERERLINLGATEALIKKINKKSY
jgi:hypothetical protein